MIILPSCCFLIAVSTHPSFLTTLPPAVLPSAQIAAWATLIEVAIITAQAWRGEASHFNTTTPVNAALYVLKLAGAVVLRCRRGITVTAARPRPRSATE